MAVKLGTEVTDNISGFSGIATSRTEYLYGCVRVGVEPQRMSDDGKIIPAEYFDEQRLDATSKADAGGPGDVPPRRDPPARR